MSYVKVLRNEIINLGYEVPFIEEVIAQLESEFGIEIVKKEKEPFSNWID